MSNYSQNTLFGPKDSLATGDPNKKILGSLLDAEFSEISTAIATKLEASSSITDGQLSSNIPLKNAANTFTASQAISAAGNSTVAMNGGTAASGAAIVLGNTADAISDGAQFGFTGSAGGLSPGGTYLHYSGGLTLFGGSGYRPNLTMADAGNVSIRAPSSGAALAITPASGADGVTVTATGNTVANISAVTGSAGSAAFTANASGTEAICLTSNRTASPGACNMPAGKTGLATATGPISIAPGAVVAATFSTGQILGAPTGGDKGAGSINVADKVYENGVKIFEGGTFTATLTGYASPPTGTVTWQRVGKLVTLTCATILGTSNANTFTMTGLPAALQPAGNAQTSLVYAIDASGDCIIIGTVSGGTITFSKFTSITNISTTGWATSGSKGFGGTNLISYVLN